MNLLVLVAVFGLLTLAQCCAPKAGATNIARNGEAMQSSNHNELGIAKKANDGNRNGNYFAGSCTHTSLDDKNSWWKLDLKQTYKIDTIIITNRQDCCQDRLKGAEVRVGNSPDNDNPVCATINDASNQFTVCCKGMEGQYVSILNPASKISLTLCEVEVYGDLAEKKFSSVCW